MSALRKLVAPNLDEEIAEFIGNVEYPCAGAKTALSQNTIQSLEATNMRCPQDDTIILEKIYDFIAEWRKTESDFVTLIVSFTEDYYESEEQFEYSLWGLLQRLHNIDSKRYSWDKRVSKEPTDKKFSFSIGGEAFYLVGMHPQASRPARRFKYPTIVFNLHEQFEALRNAGSYGRLRDIIRRRDEVFAGSINPMMSDFGDSLEAAQYSGRAVDIKTWTCPFKAKEKTNERD